MASRKAGTNLSIVDLLEARVLLSAPINDNFADRLAITGTSVTATGTNVEATKETGEPNYDNTSGGASVWWTWTAPTSQQVQIDTSDSSFDTILAVYTGDSVSSLAHVASDDDVTFDDRSSLVTFDATAGTTYQIAVDDYSGKTGSITLHINNSTTGPGDGVGAAPTDIALSANSIAENLPADTVIGTLSTTNADPDDAFTYELADGDGSAGNAAFQIVDNQLQTRYPLDYEGKRSYSIRVRAIDSDTLTFEKVFTIQVANVSEANAVARTINGSSGADKLYGQDGNDFLMPGADGTKDTLSGGDGADSYNTVDSSDVRSDSMTYIIWNSSYIGRWRSSSSTMAGSVMASRAWADITIQSNGSFSGTGARYEYVGIWNMPTAWGSIPTPIYRPGSTTSIHGTFARNGTGTLVVDGRTTSFRYWKDGSGSLVMQFTYDGSTLTCYMSKQ